MTVCEHCEYRNSWNCDDGYNRRIGGCEEFRLDWNTLRNNQKNSIRNILKAEEKCYNDYD